MAEIPVELFDKAVLPKDGGGESGLFLRPVATQSGMTRRIRFIHSETDTRPEDGSERVHRRDGINRLNTTHIAAMLLICLILIRFF